MIDLKTYIDSENLRYKIQTWVGTDNKEADELFKFVSVCKEKHCIDKNIFDDYYANFKDSKQFVDFMNDNVDRNEDNIPDYKDAFMNIMKGYIGV